MKLALVGESGCVKTLTARSIMGLLPVGGLVAGGSVVVDGRELVGIPATQMRRWRGRRLAMVFQEPQTSLNPLLTVGAQVAEPLLVHGVVPREAVAERVRELLEAVGIPDPIRRARHYPHQLSGGMMQRALLAIAIAAQPLLLIADEPTTALDVTIQAQVLALLRELQRDSGMAILLITHDLGVVATVADRLAVMYAGQVVEQAPVEEFFAAPAHPYSRRLLASLPAMSRRGRALAVIEGSVPERGAFGVGCRFERRCDRAWHRCEVEAPQQWELRNERLVRCHLHDPEEHESHAAVQTAPQPHTAAERSAGVSDQVPGPRRAPSATKARPLLRVREVHVHFPLRQGPLGLKRGELRAVDGVSLDVFRGRTLALVGESGCGKSSLAKALLRLLPLSAGTIEFEGNDLSDLDAAMMRKQRSKLQIIFQDPVASINPRMRIGDIVGEGLLNLAIEPNRRARRVRVGALLEQVGLDPHRIDDYPHQFSGGQRQRLCIARALAVGPKILVCDEPTSALDVSVQAQILNLLNSLQRTNDLAYLFISHDLKVVEYLADEVAVMYLGRIVEQGPAAVVLSQPAHPYTQALLGSVPVIESKPHRPPFRLQGEIPSAIAPPPGCHFEPRCCHALPACRVEYPRCYDRGPGHQVRCHLYGD